MVALRSFVILWSAALSLVLVAVGCGGGNSVADASIADGRLDDGPATIPDVPILDASPSYDRPPVPNIACQVSAPSIACPAAYPFCNEASPDLPDFCSDHCRFQTCIETLPSDAMPGCTIGATTGCPDHQPYCCQRLPPFQGTPYCVT